MRSESPSGGSWGILGVRWFRMSRGGLTSRIGFWGVTCCHLSIKIAQKPYIIGSSGPKALLRVGESATWNPNNGMTDGSSSFHIGASCGFNREV